MIIYVWLKNLEKMHIYATQEDFLESRDYSYFREYCGEHAIMKGQYKEHSFTWMFQKNHVSTRTNTN